MNEGTWLPAPPEPRPGLRRWVSRWPSHLMTAFGSLMMIGASPILWGENPEQYLVVFYLGVAILLIGHGMRLLDNRFYALAIRPEDAPMLPELGDPHGVLVRVWILQGHAVTGEDRGAMWIEDGRLAFCGRRTSFVIARRDVVDGFSKRGPGRLALVLDHATPAGPLAVSFTPLFGDRRYRKPLDATLAEWLADTPQAGASQFPPTALGPGAVAPGAVRRRLAREAALGALASGLFLLPVAVAYGLVPWLVGLLILGVVAWTALPRSRGRLALRDAKRLEARP